MFTVYSKDNCPFCVKAKQLLTQRGHQYKEIKVSSPDELPNPSMRTVPQIMYDVLFVGGYDDLVKKLPELETAFTVPKRTVFNRDNHGHESGKYPLFYGDALGFVDTINSPYPVLEKLYDTQMAQIWNHTEVDLTQDRQDMLNADPKVVELMVLTILWQHLADSIASRSITGVLMDAVTNSDLEGLYNAIALFETIHAKTYAHIIKQTFVDPIESLRKGYELNEIMARSNILRDAFDDLLNMPFETPVESKKRKLFVALAAIYMLESLNFMASFAVTFGIAELGIFQGISQNVSLICRDEMLHALAGKNIMEILWSTDPEIMEELKPVFAEMLEAVVAQEKSWADYLFSQGREVVGLTKAGIKKYVDFMAQAPAKTLKVDVNLPKQDENPLPYMEVYTDLSKIQVANQEIQNVSYLLNSVVNDKDNVTKVLESFRK